MSDFDDYRVSHVKSGESYDAFFRDSPRLRALGLIEEELLESIISDHFQKGGKFQCLDFACGTGRILSILEKHASRCVGVDISASMIHEAKGRVRKSELVEGDLTKDEILKESFDMITAFRFFANAQQSLREEAMSALVERMADGGILIFNNHHRWESLNERIRRIWRRITGRRLVGLMHRGMTDAEVDRLVSRAKLAIIETHHLGCLPSAHAKLLLPFSLFLWLERFFARCRLGAPLAQYKVYVCVKVPERGVLG